MEVDAVPLNLVPVKLVPVKLVPRTRFRSSGSFILTRP
jgi:hypothetical protein